MLRTVTAATSEPVSLDDAKLQLAVIYSANDAMIQGFISAARETVERLTGVALAAASYEWTPEGDRRDPLPLLPADVTSDADAYPVLFTTTPGAIPAPLRAAILMMVGELYANREMSRSNQLVDNPAFDALVWPFRRVLP